MPSHSPRPLHLATSSVTSTPTKDASSPPSPQPPSSFRQPKHFSMAATTTTQAKAARRQSSIGYFPPDSIESPRRGSLIRRKSLGTLDNGAELSQEGGGSWMGLGNRSSPMSLSTSAVLELGPVPDALTKERPPLTLTEKHADLLRFIAQKESKCLELRSQLATHEAELVQLKRKWERIVNRGLDRDVSSLLVHSSHDSGSVVLDGIREGVQGVSRLLAAGFSVSPATPLSPTNATTTATVTQAKSSKPRPLSLTHSSPFIHKSHSPKESDSSISTHATSRSTTTTTRFSQSSLSSFGEELNEGLGLEDDHSGTKDQGEDEHNHTTNDEFNMQILMVRDTGATPTMSPNPEFHRHHQHNQQRKQIFGNQQQQLSPSSPIPTHTNVVGEELLHGETWTSDVQPTTTKAHRRKSREVARLDFEHLDFSTLSPSVLLSPPAWSSLSHENSTTASPRSSPRIGGSPSPAYLAEPVSAINGSGNIRRSNSSSSMSGGSGLAPMSSIPGLGSIAAGVTVSPPPVGSWMDSMGKKLGQLQRSSTFTKSQKRASLLLADMSQSIANALAPPPSTTPSISASASVSGTPSGMKSSNLSLPAASPNPSVAGSLLDDEDEETMKFGTAVLQPVANPSTPTRRKEVVGKDVEKEGDDDDEEWNW